MLNQFVFDPTKETPADLKRRRDIAAAMSRKIGRPRTVGQGLTALGAGIAGAIQNKRASKTAEAGRESGNAAFSGILDAMRGGATGDAPTAVQAPSMDPASTYVNTRVASAHGDDPYAAFNMALAKSESGGNDSVINSEGYGGRFQFGQDRLNDYNRATGNNLTVAQLASMPADQQRQVQNWHLNDIDQFAANKGLNSYVGQEVAGVPITQNSLRAVAHLGGKGGLEKFLTTGGQYNPADSNGTRLSDYAGRFNNAGQGNAPTYNPINNKPLLSNNDGSFSTEESVTLTHPRLNGGRPTNVPSIWNGRRLSSEDEIVNHALQSGERFPAFGSINEAVFAAKQRSNILAGGVPQQTAGQDPIGEQSFQGQPAQVAQAQPQNTGPTFEQLMSASQNPWLNDSQRSMVNGLLQQKLQEMQPPSEREMLELQKLRNEVSDDGKPWWIRDDGTVDPAYLASKKAGAINITNNTGNQTHPFGKKFDETFGTQMAERAIGIGEAGAAAPAKIATLGAMKQAIANSYTGFGGESILKLRQAAKAIGMDDGDLGDAEFVRSIGNKIALELRNPSGGAGMPGAMSDKDREFLVASVPGLTKTPEGNAKLIDYMIAIEQRNQQVAQFAQEYMDNNQGRLDRRFSGALAEWSAQNPLFPEKDAPTTSGPKPGTVEDGYRFKGGDPSDENNWEIAN